MIGNEAINKVMMKRINVFSQQLIPKETFACLNNTANISALLSDLSDDLVVRLKMHVAFHMADKEEIPVTFKVHKNWFQAFKAELLPFLLRWFPTKTKVLTKTVVIEKGMVYPEMPIPAGARFSARTVNICPLIHSEEVQDEQ